MSRHSSDSKMNRKKSKYSSILHKIYGLNPSSVPTENLMICNAGLSLGVNREDLLQVFGQYGKILSVQMVPKESHSFIQFLNLTDAQNCLEGCNGLTVLPKIKGPIYLLYLECMPTIVSNELFKCPPGCIILENFVNEEEEEKLFESVKESLLDGGDLKQRKVVHFGYEFLYGKNNIDKNKPLSRGLPKECDILNDRLVDQGYVLKWVPDQLTVNHYLPGQGIPPHVDTHSAFEDPILSLSLFSDSVMDFRKDNHHWSVLLPRRSLLIMSEESRYAWSHGIASRKSDIIMDDERCLLTKERSARVSFTFRRIRFSPCDCSYEKYCDSRQSPTVAPDIPSNDLEQEYVHKVYEDISGHFSRTRHKPWPAVLDLVRSLEPGSIVLDVGCGNCKYFGFASHTFEIGSDHSLGLLSISRDRGFQAVRSNCLSLPFKDSSVDCLLCIAVIHHLSSKERRIQSIKEMLRVLTPSGQALIYVWAKDQKYQGKSSNYLKYQKQPYGDQLDANSIQKSVAVELPVHVNRTDFSEGQNDVFVPWKLKTESTADPSSTYLRFYHVFDEGELDELCRDARAHIIKSYYDNGNWCCLISKNPDEFFN